MEFEEFNNNRSQNESMQLAPLAYTNMNQLPSGGGSLSSSSLSQFQATHRSALSSVKPMNLPMGKGTSDHVSYKMSPSRIQRQVHSARFLRPISAQPVGGASHEFENQLNLLKKPYSFVNEQEAIDQTRQEIYASFFMEKTINSQMPVPAISWSKSRGISTSKRSAYYSRSPVKRSRDPSQTIRDIQNKQQQLPIMGISQSMSMFNSNRNSRVSSSHSQRVNDNPSNRQPQNSAGTTLDLQMIEYECAPIAIRNTFKNNPNCLHSLMTTKRVITVHKPPVKLQMQSNQISGITKQSIQQHPSNDYKIKGITQIQKNDQRKSLPDFAKSLESMNTFSIAKKNLIRYAKNFQS